MTVTIEGHDDAARALADDALSVRPPGEPVPRHLLGTPLGELFARFARMNDGARHARLRTLVDRRLLTFTDTAVRRAAERAAELARQTAAGDAPRLLFLMRFAYPAAVAASLLGFADCEVFALASDARRIVLAVAAASDPAATADGCAALAALDRAFARHERLRELSDDARANAIGLMFQAVDGCAGLIGNALVQLARGADGRDLPALVANVACHDAAIHTTRRYGSEGDTMLVRLTSGLPFGNGPHACPGREIALTIASVALATLLAADTDLGAFAEPAYLASVNARIPVCPMDGAFG